MKQNELSVFSDDADVERAWKEGKQALATAVERANNAPSAQTAKAIDTAVAQVQAVQAVMAQKIRRFEDTPGQARTRPFDAGQRRNVEMFLKSHPDERDCGTNYEELKRAEQEFLRLEQEHSRLLVATAVEKAAAFVPGTTADPTLPGQLVANEWRRYIAEKELLRLQSLVVGRQNAVIRHEQQLAQEKKKAAEAVEKAKREAAERVAYAESQLKKIRPKR